ncbi:MAG: hypothetical protein K2P41_17360 [Lachnospiraceae bacterium]|nr:hypothetical protein [Lachnospiraceae bacterium]
MIRKNLKRIPATAIAFVMLFCCMLGSTVAYASKTSLSVSANVYDLDKDSHYVIGETSPSTSSAIGTLSIKGVVKVSDEINSFPAYEVRDGYATFAYRISSSILNRAEDEWHLINDKTKKVNDLTLDSNILSGALILQTSLDGVTWTEDILMSDIFAEDADTDEFYTTKDVQLQNGCYYRVIVAYKMERQTEDSKILFVTTKNYEYKQVAEVYEFYAFCKTDETSPDATPMKKLGSKINTGKDNGYSGNEPIDKDDPHYGWDIGYFYVNGYTRETAIADQTPMFLKNVGDKVTLWFHLSEDINKLHGNELLTISEDTNGYDRTFEIDQTNFEHGTLIIQYTNAQGEVQEPIIYTDYLAANARTGANTKVQLFEEGDYVVSLDYEIKSMGGAFNQFASYTNYKIMFEFSIRNGNCMVYPFDSLTGAELADNAITENGFNLDMAKSKYLTIDVQRSVLVVGTDGYLTEDVRFNRPAKDGETYTSEGIYTFKVTNLYTGETTKKTIYIGANSYLRALSATGMSIAELNAEIEKGAIVHEDGTLEVIAPVETEPTETPAETETESTSPVTEEPADDTPVETQEPIVDVSTDINVDEKPQEMNVTPFVIGAISVVIIASVFVIIKRKKAYQARLNEEEVHEE